MSPLRHVNEGVNVRLVPLDVFVFDEPLDLLFDHLLLWQEHVLQDLHQLRLQLGIGDLLAHLHNLDDGFLLATQTRGNEALMTQNTQKKKTLRL